MLQPLLNNFKIARRGSSSYMSTNINRGYSFLRFSSLQPSSEFSPQVLHTWRLSVKMKWNKTEIRRLASPQRVHCVRVICITALAAESTVPFCTLQTVSLQRQYAAFSLAVSLINAESETFFSAHSYAYSIGGRVQKLCNIPMNKTSHGRIGSKWRENTMNLMFTQKLNDPLMNVALPVENKHSALSSLDFKNQWNHTLWIFSVGLLSLNPRWDHVQVFAVLIQSDDPVTVGWQQ